MSTNRLLRSAKKAIRRILKRCDGPGDPELSAIPDPRKKKGKRYSFSAIRRLLLLGMLGGYKALRGVVAFGEELNLGISYTPLYNILGQLQGKDVRPVLHQQVRKLHRAKCLQPEGFPCPIAAIDGKSIYYGPYKLNEFCQRRTETYSGGRRYNLRVMRTTLVSASMRPTIDQQPIPAETSEEGYFKQYFDSLLSLYGQGLLHNAIYTIDAGYCSLSNATHVNDTGHGYILALKNNQPGLIAETRRVFDSLREQSPEYVSEWRVYQGKQMRTLFYRTKELQSWPTSAGEWTHLRQVWLIVTEQRTTRGRKKRGRKKSNATPEYTEPKVTEERFYATNVPWEYLKAKQCVAAVRSHWGVENNANWVTDVIWNEDDAPWCRQGEALLVLSLLRLLALNMVLWLRHRVLSNKRMKKWEWKQWLRWIGKMAEQFVDLSVMGGLAEI